MPLPLFTLSLTTVTHFANCIIFQILQSTNFIIFWALLLIWLSYIVHQRKILFLKKSGFIITVVWSIFSWNTHRSIGRIMSKFSIHILYSNSNNNIKQHMWHHLVVVSINNRKLSMFWLWTLNFIFTTAGSQQSNTVHSKIHEKRNTDMYKKKLSQNC